VWTIDRTDEIATWIISLDEDALEAVLRSLLILKEIGPSLGRPHVDTVKRSRHKNMKELWVQNRQRVFRIFFAFDPDRKALLLIGGDKRNDKKFYERMVPLADALLDKHLKKWRKIK
jgi:hypothetical protein